MDRARICLKLFYDPDMSVDDRVEMIDKFGRALKGMPRWAVSKGFDQWEKTMQRRPSPGDIFILADRECKRIRDELADREKMAKTPEQIPERTIDEKLAAERVMQSAGFTVKRMEAAQRHPMATTETELYAERPINPHWSELAASDSPEIEALHRARLENPIMRASMAKLQASR